MIRAFYTGGSGMISQQQRLDTHASNIANVHTAGFKKSRVFLTDQPYAPLHPVSANRGHLFTGQGVRPTGSQRDFAQGALQETGRALDLAIEGPGFFTVRSPGGDVRYTRDGSFQISVEGGRSYVVTAQGDYLLNASGAPIAFNGAPDTLPQQAARVTFANPEGLEAAGAGQYRETAASGPSRLAFDGTVHQGFLEGANLQLAEEMTAIIQTQRIFQLNARMVQTADTMMETVNNLRS